ncbi:hypothetical protein ZWY2020_058236 [Hordeum vulgare]|nr:hypothetical protein ZWY2020_058236 [Hordeum vulgare]
MISKCIYPFLSCINRTLHVFKLQNLKKDKYNNEDPSPIEFFKETHTKRKTGSMSPAALNAYHSQKMSSDVDTQIVAGVLKEHSSSSTFLSTMGYQSRSGRSRTSAS